MKIRNIGSNESSEERDRIRDLEREKAAQDRAMSSKDREKAVAERNAERKQERESATQSIQSGNVNLQEIVRQGGSLGRKIEREIRQFEQTGKVSSWLAGETLKAEAAQNAAQQSAFRQAVVDVVSTSQNPIELAPTRSFFSPLFKKPELEAESEDVSSIPPHPFKITSRQNPVNENQYFVTVDAGTVNNVLASNWTSTSSVDSKSTLYVGLRVSSSTNRVVSSQLIFSSTPIVGEATPVKWGVPSLFSVLLGVISLGRVFQVVFNNLSYNAQKRITTDRPSPQAGLLPYDNWYTWVRVN
jgi:hypothetical protein